MHIAHILADTHSRVRKRQATNRRDESNASTIKKPILSVEAQTEKTLGLKPMPKDTGFGLTPKAVEEAELVRNKEIVDAKDISQEPPTAKQLAKTAIDFTPVIGDIVGGYEAAAEINEELKEVNPNYVYIGVLGGATAVGMIPFLGDAAKKLMDLGALKVKRAKEKVECECGSVVRKDSLSKHKKTQKHQNYLKSLEEN